MNTEMESAEEGKRYRVVWSDCCASGDFEAVLKAKNYVPDPPEPEPFLESLTFANGVTISGHGIGLEKVAHVAPDPDPAYETGYRDGESNREADIRIAVEHSRTLEELIQRLRDMTGCQDMNLGDEYED